MTWWVPYVLSLLQDTSNTGIGAVLLQERDGLLHPVLYASRKLLDRETRYSTIERECLARSNRFRMASLGSLETFVRSSGWSMTTNFPSWSPSLLRKHMILPLEVMTRFTTSHFLAYAHIFARMYVGEIFIDEDVLCVFALF